MDDDLILEQELLLSELQEPFLLATNTVVDEDEEPRKQPSRRRILIDLIKIVWGGSLVGMLSAFVGLYCLDTFANLPTKSSMVWYSFTWSLCTASLAYGVFYGSRAIFQVCKRSTAHNDNSRIQAERYFCLGVFVGFCVTCTIHDAAKGFPVLDIALTAIASAMWVILMMVWTVEGEKSVYSHRLPLDVLV